MTRNALIVSLMAAVALAGCSGTYLAPDISEVNKRLMDDYRLEKRDADCSYTVEPPDVISVEAVGLPELTREARVRQDGRVSLPLLQDVEVRGLSPEQIRDKLETMYSRYYTDISLLVSVVEFNSKFIFVHGEVRNQDLRFVGFSAASGAARFPYTGSQTVLDVMGAAGGFTNRAAPWRVVVARGDPHTPERYLVDLKKLLIQGDARQNVVLAPNDVVYVPPNFMAWLGYTVENAMFPVREALPVKAWTD